ncbi:MAG: hypothetical protein NBV63_02460 [Candidatus Pacebacteria bacterium]|nr:hypothetical protein [Candidatus Paceibacterota bacterium]
MNKTTAFAALIAVLVVAGGAYYTMMPGGAPVLSTGTPPAETGALPGETGEVTTSAPVPAATDSIDDFAAAMQAELAASASAIKALDMDVDASVDSVVNSGNTVYDPSTL